MTEKKSKVVFRPLPVRDVYKYTNTRIKLDPILNNLLQQSIQKTFRDTSRCLIGLIQKKNFDKENPKIRIMDKDYDIYRHNSVSPLCIDEIDTDEQYEDPCIQLMIKYKALVLLDETKENIEFDISFMPETFKQDGIHFVNIQFDGVICRFIYIIEFGVLHSETSFAFIIIDDPIYGGDNLDVPMINGKTDLYVSRIVESEVEKISKILNDEGTGDTYITSEHLRQYSEYWDIDLVGSLIGSPEE